MKHAQAGDDARSTRRAAAQAIRPLWTQVYIPNLLLAMGQGAMLPVLVYATKQVHGSTAAAGGIVAINGFGTMLFDLPAGRIVSRLGERRAGAVATLLMTAGLLGCIVAQSVPVLGVSVFVQAAGLAVWTLVRMTHLSRAAPTFARGRALSLFGGIMRAGNVIGPFLFVAVARHNDARPAFVIYLGGVLVGYLWLLAARDRNDTASRLPSEQATPPGLFRDQRRAMLAAGVAALMVSVLRGSRTAIVPLWATHIGLSATSAAALFAYSSVIDLALFYPAGVASDRFGRRAVAVPCIALLAAGHVLIPFTHSFSSLFGAAFILAIGNGLGSGIVMTLGADLAPEAGRASFLAIWRMISDGGSAAGPLIDSAVVGLASLAAAGPVIGLLGAAGALVVALFLEEPVHLRRTAVSPVLQRRTRRAEVDEQAGIG